MVKTRKGVKNASPETKRRAAVLIVEEEVPVKEVALRFDVHQTTVAGWARAYKEGNLGPKENSKVADSNGYDGGAGTLVHVPADEPSPMPSAGVMADVSRLAESFAGIDKNIAELQDQVLNLTRENTEMERRIDMQQERLREQAAEIELYRAVARTEMLRNESA